MYRRLGSKHLFQKLDGSSSLPGCDLAKMTRSIRFLYYSLSYVNLFKDRLSLSLSLSRRMLCSEKRVQRYGIFFIPSKCFERKVCESWRFFALFYKTRVKRGCFWGNGRKKGKAVVKERTVYICHYREISPPLSFNYFLLIIYRGWMSEKKGHGWAKKGGGRRKSLAYPLRGRPKSLRQSFGMVSGSVRDGKRYADKWISHARELT